MCGACCLDFSWGNHRLYVHGRACVCVSSGVYIGLKGFRCISDASYHIWVTAAVPQGVGGVRNWGFGEEGNRQHQ